MKALKLAGIALGSLALTVAICALVFADGNFTGYPDTQQIWIQSNELRVRSGGQIGFGDGRTAPVAFVQFTSNEISFSATTDVSGYGVQIAGYGPNWGGVDSAVTGNYTIDFVPNVVLGGAIKRGTLVSWMTSTASTENATLTVDAVTKNLHKSSAPSDDIDAGEIVANQICIAIYDGTQWQVIGE